MPWKSNASCIPPARTECLPRTWSSTCASTASGHLQSKEEWQDLKNHLGKGRPLIIALNLGRGDLHYVVVTGLDSRQDLVLKHDPAGRKLLRQHRADFEKEWWARAAIPALRQFRIWERADL